MLVVVPSWREKLLEMMLWMQLEIIWFAHDFHVYHGYIHLTWPWMMQPFGGTAPDWVKRLQLRIMYFIAWMVMAVVYRVGTLFLGMKGEYTEYSPTAYEEKAK